MRIVIFTHVPATSTRGNRITAERWQTLLSKLEHDVQVVDNIDVLKRELAATDFVIGIHALHSAEALREANKHSKNIRTAVAITGTDLHVQFASKGKTKDEILATLESVTRIIFLEPESVSRIPEHLQQKVSVIIQSAVPLIPKPEINQQKFIIAVVGHLRDVKDPFLTAQTLKLLPKDSNVQVNQIGQALSEEMNQRAVAYSNDNSRYKWIGEVTHEEAQRHIAESQLLILTSKLEGAPSVFSEAIVNHVPILCTRIDASLGLLGKDYPGMFQVGNIEQLAELIRRTESDSDFYQSLKTWIDQIRQKFLPEAEIESLNHLISVVATNEDS